MLQRGIRDRHAGRGRTETAAGERERAAAPLPGAIQAKLAVGRVDDPLEHEADRIADRVMRMPDPGHSESRPGAGGGAPIRLQAKAATSAGTGGEAPATVREVLGSTGRPLDASTRAFFEPRFGRDLGDVRVHADAEAAASARAVGALAYTVGRDVVFGAGSYAPHSEAGRRLLAHELTHTLQQNGAPPQVQRWPSFDGFRAASSSWTKKEIEAIQKQLKQLGLYSGTVDGGLGAGTKVGLTEAFGDNSWQMLPAGAALTQLTAAKAAAGGKKGQHKLRWGEMFRDGLLDMTLGLGFDEGDNHKRAHTAIASELAGRSFIEDKDDAILLYKNAGRPVGPAAFGDYFVKRKAISYSPPVNPTGVARPVHFILRFVYSLSGAEGAQAAAAFQAGMTSSDISYYAGHARYGSGPDFDPNFSFELLDAAGKVQDTIRASDVVGSRRGYQLLEDRLALEGKAAGRSAWKQFQWRESKGRIRVNASNAGNVFLRTDNPFAPTKEDPKKKEEFGANLMYWNLNRTKGGAVPVTGKKGALAAPPGSGPERDYRLMVFTGCTTQFYEKSIRATPGMGPREVDMVTSTRPLYWRDLAKSLGQFLDGVLKQQSAEQIVTDMDEKLGDQPGDLRTSGLQDNPVIK